MKKEWIANITTYQNTVEPKNIWCRPASQEEKTNLEVRFSLLKEGYSFWEESALQSLINDYGLKLANGESGLSGWLVFKSMES